MKRRERWRAVLDVEVARWSEKSYDQLRAELADTQDYEVEFYSKPCQVEVELLENTEEYVHVDVRIDDGSLPWSIFPANADFIRRRSP
jgi:hypothetical protein